jgi:trigger factor
MNITQEKIDSLNAIVKINLAPADYQPRVEKIIKEQAKKAKLPGFRPGLVPPAHIKKMHGKAILVEEINHILSDTLNNYLEEQQLEVLGQPLAKPEGFKDYNWDFNDDFEFIYELGLAPEFEINFSAFDKIVQYDIKVDDETLQARIKNIRRSYGKMTNPDVSADDDVLYADLVQLSPDGSVFDDGISNTTSIRLDQVQDEKTKAQLIGLKKDDEVVLDIQKAYNHDAARIAAILKVDEETAADIRSNFRLTVKNINRLEESDLNQEFFDKLFGEGIVTTEAEFTQKITEEVETMMAQDSERKLQNDLFLYSLNKIQFNLPDEFLKRWLKATNEKLTDEELEGGYSDFAQNLKWTLIENKIIKQNEIELKYEEVFAAAKQSLGMQFAMYGQPMSEEQLGQYTVQYLQKKENANKVFEEVKAAKALDWIKSVLTVERQEISSKAFSELR